MRVQIDLPKDQVQKLNKVVRARKISRAAVIREAVSAYLDAPSHKVPVGFGLWRGRGIDGLKYQEKLRNEW